MRLSVEKDDPGYNEICCGSGFKVYLNGEERVDCVTADEEKGFVLVYDTNEEGKFFMIGGNEVAKKVLYGKVEIRVPDHVVKFLKRGD